MPEVKPFRVFDADAHLFEGDDAWKYLEPEYEHRRPRQVAIADAPPTFGTVDAFWAIDGRLVPAVAFLPRSPRQRPNALHADPPLEDSRTEVPPVGTSRAGCGPCISDPPEGPTHLRGVAAMTNRPRFNARLLRAGALLALALCGAAVPALEEADLDARILALRAELEGAVG